MKARSVRAFHTGKHRSAVLFTHVGIEVQCLSKVSCIKGMRSLKARAERFVTRAIRLALNKTMALACSFEPLLYNTRYHEP